MKCLNCKASLSPTARLCIRCGTATNLSDPDASLDQMVQRASVPNLSTLFRRAKTAGAIVPVSVYGEGKPS